MAVGAYAETVEIVDKEVQFSKFESFPYFPMGYTPNIIDGVLTSEYPGNWYQYFIADDFNVTSNSDYKVTVMIKAAEAGNLGLQFGNWAPEGTPEDEKGNYLKATQLPVTTEWAEQTVNMNSGLNSKCFVCLQPGTFPGKVEIKWVKVSHMGEKPSEELPAIIQEPAKGTEERISVDMSALKENWDQGTYDATTHLYTSNNGWANLMDLTELVNMEPKYKRVVVNVSYVNTTTQSGRFCTGDGGTLRKVLLEEGINEISITSEDDLSRVRIGGTGAGQKMVIHYIYADTNTPTAINNVAVESAANAEFVNAAGQKVGKNYKGLVINKATGKKFINK